MNGDESVEPVKISAKPARTITGQRTSARPNQIPDEILEDPILNQRIATALPSNYNLEIHKTIWRIRKISAKRVCLQFPDGLFIFAVPIVNILKEFLPETEFVVMADTVYGACCIDDTKAKELDCDMLVHYGHSCLIPINQMASGVSILYIFVDIKFDILHFIQTVVKNFDPTRDRLYFAGTIQFVSSVHLAARELREKHSFEVLVPQSRPLTPGEILGCTAPFLDTGTDSSLVFVADGRFHLEALMIANPNLPSYRYNPYNKELTREYYSNDEMLKERTEAVRQMEQIIRNDEPVGIILGTLGRQGSFKVLEVLETMIGDVSRSPVATFLIAEITPELLETIGRERIKGWVQIGCPRLSIDWANSMVSKPLLTPYELRTAIRNLQDDDSTRNLPNFTKDGKYPMDFYATSSLGPWTPSHKCHGGCDCDKQ